MLRYAIAGVKAKMFETKQNVSESLVSDAHEVAGLKEAQPKASYNGALPKQNEWMEQILADLLSAAEVTQHTLHVLQEADVLTIEDLRAVSSRDLPDLGLSDGERSKIIWEQELARPEHLSGVLLGIRNLQKAVDGFSDEETQELIKRSGVSVGKRSILRSAIEGVKAKMLQTKRNVSESLVSDAHEVTGLKEAQPKASYNGDLPKRNEWMEQILADLLSAAEVTQHTLHVLQEADVLTIEDLRAVSSRDLPDLGLSDGERSKIIWEQELARPEHLSGILLGIRNLQKAVDEFSDEETQVLIKGLGVSVGKRSKLRSAIEGVKAKMLETKQNVSESLVSDAHEVAGLKEAQPKASYNGALPKQNEWILVSDASHDKLQLETEEDKPLSQRTSSLDSLDDDSIVDGVVEDDITILAPMQSPKHSKNVESPLNLGLIKDILLTSCVRLSDVKDRKAILVIGNTGAGKSLFLNHIAGRTIVKNRIRIKGIEQDVWDAENPLCQVGHLNESQTSAVHVFPLSGDGNCVAVDTAGFGDTREEERDIATAIALKMVVDSASACRFAAVLNCHGWFEARAEGVRTLARLLTDFIDFVQFEQCVDFVFTKCHALEIRMPPLQAATKAAVAERKKSV